MARFFFVPLILCCYFLLFPYHAQGVNFKSKSSLVKGILQKVLNLTLTSFADTSNKEKEKMIMKIEKRLNESAQFLGPKKEKYVGLIMDGVRSIASGTGSKSLDSIRTYNGSENVDDYDEVYSTDEVLQQGSTKLVKTNKNTTNKINIFTDKPLKHSNNSKEQKNVDDIQQNISDSTFLKQVIMKYKRDAGLLNTDLITKDKKGVDSKEKEKKMEFGFIDEIKSNKDEDAKHIWSKSNDVLSTPTVGGNKIDADFCQNKYANTCIQIKALNTIKCSGKTIPVDKLCDGVDDCFNYSDEQDCAIQGVDKVRNASQLILDIEDYFSNNCITLTTDSLLILKQNEVLHSVLQSQLKYIQKQATVVKANDSQSNFRKFYTEPVNVKKSVNAVAILMMTLSTSLERTFCSNAMDPARKYKDEDEVQRLFESESIKTTTWSPKFCKCIEEYCVGACSDDCGFVCLQRYQIGKWQCNAVSNKTSISLDFICDGKLDCYDESDESACLTDAELLVPGLAKFEANYMYNVALDMISTKSKAINSNKVRSMLVNLQMLIENLQKLTTKLKPNVVEVKALRDECFSEIVAIYDQTRFYQVSMDVMNDIYMFLISLNEKLVNAMKRSHIGNEKIISSDGCFCRDNRCALLECSKECIRACPVEPKLTRYFCGGSSAMNQSIPIEAICNGKNDCPDKDDEENCSEEICRKHHLVVLRHNLKEVTEENSDPAVGEALKIWKTKVSATNKILESNERPTPKILRDIVNDMLHELLMTYATLTSTRRNDDQVIAEFYKMALVVISSLKSCAK